MNKFVKLLHKSSNSLLNKKRLGVEIFRISLYSTQTQSSSSETLYRRLQRCYEPRVSVIPVLDKWILEGRRIDTEDLKGIVKNFRKKGRFKHALELAEWMRGMKHLNFGPGHIAVQLDLISKVHGLKQAEDFFNSLEDSLLCLRVYGALLNCYADKKSLEKAEAVMEEMRKLNCCSNLVYNRMLSLYSKMQVQKKFDSLMQEMEHKGIEFDKYTYNIRLNAYASCSNVEGMEKLLMKMEVDPLVTVDFISYLTAAKGYLKVNSSEKALVAVRKAEHLIISQKKMSAYGTLMITYATMKRKEDVYRIWNLLEKGGKPYNKNYLCMLTSLLKLDDLDGAKEVLEEWLEKHIKFGSGIPESVVRAYCNKGCVKEAELIIKRLEEAGKKPGAGTWSFVALGYCKNGLMEKAVETTKKAMLASSPGWKPDIPTIAACLIFLQEKGDVDGIREILMLLEKCGNFSADFKERVERYLYNGKPRSEAVGVGIVGVGIG